MEPRDVVRDFDTYFEIVPATTDALRDEVYGIRYRVYAEELGWENAHQFPAHREQDEYDHRSVHCLLRHRGSNEYMGCVRLVMVDAGDPGALLPIESAYGRSLNEGGLQPSALADRTACGEISRVAVVSNFRRRSGEQNSPLTTIDVDALNDSEGGRRFPHIALGLYLAAAAIGVSRGLNAVYALMEPKLARRLRMFGMRFEQVTDPIEHHGLRAGYKLTRDTFEEGLPPPMKALFDFIRPIFLN